MEVGDIGTLSEITLKWLANCGKSIKPKGNSCRKESDALKTLMHSVSSTSIYMKLVLDNPENRSNKKEHELSNMWSDTAIKVRPYKAELAERCFFKGLYWANTNRFTEEELKQRKLKLTDIERDISSAIKSI